MADDKRKPAPRRAGAGTGAKGASGGASRAGGGSRAGGSRGGSGAGRGSSASRDATGPDAAMTAASGAADPSARGTRQATTPGADIDEQIAAGSGPGAGRADDTPATAAELGGGTADGDGLTAAALTASSLGDDALADASEPIVIVESLTVLSETPLQGDAADDASTDDPSGGQVDPQHRWLMIAERAYLRAAERGFAPGGELEDWLNAEQEVDARLSGRGG